MIKIAKFISGSDFTLPNGKKPSNQMEVELTGTIIDSLLSSGLLVIKSNRLPDGKTYVQWKLYDNPVIVEP